MLQFRELSRYKIEILVVKCEKLGCHVLKEKQSCHAITYYIIVMCK